MKKIFFALFVWVSCIFAAKAQDTYEPMDTWPYKYEHFQAGNIRTTKGTLFEYKALNVNLADGKLHYIENDKIMQADMGRVFTALIGDMDVYVNAGGKMYQVLGENEYGSVLKLTSVDMDELNKVDIGYGVSSSTASRTNTTLAGLGMENLNGVNMVSMTLANAENRKHTGMVLPLKERFFLNIDGKLIPANKREVMDVVDKKAAKDFFKANKIKWNKPESLVLLLPFLKEQLNK